MNLSPIKKVRVYEQVIEQIKESLEQGAIQPGDKLPSERELAEELSVSRSVVREAMSVLNASGIIHIRPGIGVFLAEGDRQALIIRMNRVLNKEGINLSEVYELRQGLEGQAAFLAAKKATANDLKNIQQAFEELELALLNNKLAAEEDFALHLAIVKASKNGMIEDMMRLIAETALDGTKTSRSQSKRSREALVQEHREIVHAIIDRDAERARELMIKHLDTVINRSVGKETGDK